MNARHGLALGTLVAALCVPALASAQTWYPVAPPAVSTQYVPAGYPVGVVPQGYPVAVAPQGYPVATDRGCDRGDAMRRGARHGGFLGQFLHHLQEGFGG